ncbi:hypothetical protein B0H13DRAFT_1884068 [Mycena leptocephala]|nr:hypothetical protein B0H13DRAFT_1884068 [Mycena leptocephala]
MPKPHEWETFYQWIKTFSDLITFLLVSEGMDTFDRGLGAWRKSRIKRVVPSKVRGCIIKTGDMKEEGGLDRNFLWDNFGECNFGKRQLPKVATPKSRNFENWLAVEFTRPDPELSTVPLDFLELYFLLLNWDIDIRLGPTYFSLLLDVKDDL